MDISSELIKLEQKYQSEKEIISMLEPVAKDVSFVSDKKVYFKHRTYIENTVLLHMLYEIFGVYKLNHYYMNGDRVTLSYDFDKFNAQLFCTDNEFALKQLSGGKCRVVEKTEKTTSIVCDTTPTCPECDTEISGTLCTCKAAERL